MTSSLVLLAGLLAGAAPAERPTVVVVVGAAGASEYEKQFNEWAGRWARAADQADATLIRLGQSDDDETSVRDQIRNLLASQKATSQTALWLVFIGHGTFDGQRAKFNLPGPDITAAELAGWLDPLRRPVAVINCASSSGPFINRLAGEDRVIVTAAKSGYEYNFARFGDYLSAAIADPKADLDKDHQVSLLEAFLAASRRVEEFYKEQGRLATEHALLEDSGDGLGVPATWFRGIRATRKAKSNSPRDGVRAHQFHLITAEDQRAMSPQVRAERDELELAIERLRDIKPDLEEAAYYQQLEKLLVDLARLYERSEPGLGPSENRTDGRRAASARK